ncbi:hypothetical protein FRC03_002918 [Tulasnella sp. 419]|nr:hypothetical protein FRC03_002918 [Tulasnella sp. 419]
MALRSVSANQPSSLSDDEAPVHRIRHITGVLVCNLTPFPARDQVTSSLHQTSIASSQGIEGDYAPDDTDLTLSRRRQRNLSSTSLTTLRSIRPSEEPHSAELGGSFAFRDKSGESPRRTRKISRGSFNFDPGPSTAQSPPKPRRLRSQSQVSLGSLMIPPSAKSPTSPSDQTPQSPSNTYPASTSTSSLQRSLEGVVSSRLVETVLTLSLPPSLHPNPSPSRPPSPLTPKDATSPPRTSRMANVNLSRGRGSVTARRPVVAADKGSPSSSKLAPKANGTPARHTPSSRSLSASKTPVAQAFPASSTPASRSTSPTTTDTDDLTPFYVSPHHRPSTNPSWMSLDPQVEFSSWVEPHATKLSAVIWGDTTNSEAWKKGSTLTGSLKGKEKVPDWNMGGDGQWQPLVQWDIDLEKAMRLPPELESKPQNLPPNSIVIALLPSNDLYYFPPMATTTSMSPPSSGYISDSELDPRVKTSATELPGVTARKAALQRMKEQKPKLTSTWQDIVKLATLESVLADTRKSLNAVIQSTDAAIGADQLSITLREASEREFRITGLSDDTSQLKAKSKKLAELISSRRSQLEERRRCLRNAQDILSECDTTTDGLRSEVAEQRERLAALAKPISKRRATLIQTVDTIFPVEFVSSSELLFSILDVPLPLPIGTSDPAPPLSVPSHPSINEETIATALGYVAQVVHMVASYLGRLLPYPITSAGSRSMIRDPISTMQGPRVFPLFSKGTETYRFEYAVFLLNKDIEMLMTDHNLRAMDMRHTLPNLKNLMLTLTTDSEELDGGESNIVISVAPDPSQPAEPQTDGELTGSLPRSNNDDTTSLPLTPPTPNSTPRRQFLSPLAAILRSKYASALRPITVTEEPPDMGEDTSSGPDGSEIATSSQAGSEDPMTPTPNGESTSSEENISSTEESSGSTDLDDTEDVRTERGVNLEEGVEEPKNTERPSREGYGMGMLSSFFIRTPSEKKGRETSPHPRPQPPPPPLPNVV